MNLSDTVDLMCSSDYKQRFLAEYKQLIIRISGLSNMLKKYKEGTLDFTPKCSYEVLQKQLNSMIKYACDLEIRANIENIEL